MGHGAGVNNRNISLLAEGNDPVSFFFEDSRRASDSNWFTLQPRVEIVTVFMILKVEGAGDAPRHPFAL